MVSIVFTLIVIGVLLYLVERFIPMDASIKNIIRIVVVVGVVIWLLQVLGIISGMPRFGG